jgi:hypothetical protein
MGMIVCLQKQVEGKIWIAGIVCHSSQSPHQSLNHAINIKYQFISLPG